jgi:fibronectin-binding autotransporter adhesin
MLGVAVSSLQFTGGSLRQYGGTLALYGDNPNAVAAEVQGDATTLFVQGSQPNLNTTMLWEMESAACPHLTGDGMVGDVTGCGHITLDSTLSVKNIGRGVCGTCYYNTLTIRLNGTNVGEYGKLVASGDVSLSSGSLSPSPGFNPQAGQIYTIVEKTSAGVITTEFLGPEGTITTLNGMPFRISYVGGDGNDVTLTAILPRLNVARTSDPSQVRLSWPTNYPAFHLQRASAITGSAPFSFQDVPVSPFLTGGNYTITAPAATNHEFFRLKQDE